MATTTFIALIIGVILLVWALIASGEALEKFGENKGIWLVRVFGVLLGFCGKVIFFIIWAIILIMVISAIAQLFPGSDGLTVTPPVYTR